MCKYKNYDLIRKIIDVKFEVKLPRSCVKAYFNIALLLFFTIFSSCSKKLVNEKWLATKAPEYFTARFETTQGNFEIEAKRVWSPQAVDRLYQLLKSGYYHDIAIFRVVPNYIAQFGIHDHKVLNHFWNKHPIDDEAVIENNDAFTLSFARGGKKSRTTQLFINLKHNNNLDDIDFGGVKGFPVVAKITSGKAVVKKFYDGYGDQLGRKQDSINARGNDFLKRKYPKIDYIVKAYLLKK